MFNAKGIVVALHKWQRKPAKEWHFWLPQSGLVGGFIATVVLTGFAYLVVGLIRNWR